MEAFRSISDTTFSHGVRGMPVQGEGLAATWEPVKARMLGFGMTMRNLLRERICHQDHFDPGEAFEDAVKIRGRPQARSDGLLSAGTARRSGAILALNPWNALAIDGRWGLRQAIRRTVCDGRWRASYGVRSSAASAMRTGSAGAGPARFRCAGDRA